MDTRPGQIATLTLEILLCSRVLNKHNTVMIRKDTKQQESFDESLLYNNVCLSICPSANTLVRNAMGAKFFSRLLFNIDDRI